MNTPLADLLRGKKLYLLDMDGTLYLGSSLFPTALPFLKAIKDSGAQYLFLTNNSSRGTDSYVKKLSGMGIPAREEDFFTSTDAACAYLRAHYRGGKIYALGTASFREHLKHEGFPITDQMEEGIDCLLMGYDTELTYQKLIDASILLGKGVTYLATNPDWVCPTAFGYVPDCGSIAQALEHATGRLPRFLGKPQPEIARLAMAKKGVMIVSNPPYIKDEDICKLMSDVKDYEPYEALYGGEDGVEFYIKITKQSLKLLDNYGILAFEIGDTQKNQVMDIMKSNGFSNIYCIKDLAGRDRVVKGILKR